MYIQGKWKQEGPKGCLGGRREVVNEVPASSTDTTPPTGQFLESQWHKGFPLCLFLHISHFHASGRDIFIGRQEMRLQTPSWRSHSSSCLSHDLWTFGSAIVGRSRTSGWKSGPGGHPVGTWGHHFQLWVISLVLALAGSQSRVLPWIERGDLTSLYVASEEGGRAGNGRFYPKGESLFLALKESYFIMILAIDSLRQTLSHFILRNLLLSLLLSLAHLTLPTNVFSAPTPNAPESALFLFMGHELNGAWPQSTAKRVDQRNKRQLVVLGSVHVDLQNKLYP